MSLAPAGVLGRISRTDANAKMPPTSREVGGILLSLDIQTRGIVSNL